MTIRYVDFTRHGWRRPTQPYQIALLSDVHFGNRKQRDRQIQAIREIDRLNPAFLVLMGDNVETARPEHYAEAKELLKGVQTPILPITGNHEIFPHFQPVDDCLDRFRQAFGFAQPYFHRVLPPYHFIFLGIDQRQDQLPQTVRDTGISPAQLHWFRDRLQEHPHRPTVVVTHAPLLGTVQNSEYFYLAQSAELLTILRDAPQICLWVSGHTHLPDIHNGKPLRTLITDAKGHTFLHVPPVADYYVHLVHGQRRYFRLPELRTRLLDCHADRITIRTLDLHTGDSWVNGDVVPGQGLFRTA